jgi:hypothetical protein
VYCFPLRLMLPSVRRMCAAPVWPKIASADRSGPGHRQFASALLAAASKSDDEAKVDSDDQTSQNPLTRSLPAPVVDTARGGV